MQEEQLQEYGELLKYNSNSKKRTNNHANKCKPLEEIKEPINLISWYKVILWEFTKSIN